MEICTICNKEFSDEEIYVTKDDVVICEECKDKDFIVCDNCIEICSKEEMTQVDNCYFCDNCLQDMDVYECYACGRKYLSEDVIKIDGQYYCEECVSDTNYETCECCGENYTVTICSADTGEYYCEDCADRHFTECVRCGDYFSSNLSTDIDGNYVCNSCIDEEYSYCCECDEYVLNNETYWEGDNCYCSNCYGRIIHTENLHGWDFEPIFNFIQTDSEPKDIATMFIGVELERNIDEEDNIARKQCVDNIAEQFEEIIYCKKDGSVADGFEIVSHPATYNAHMTKIDWKKIFKICAEHGFDSNDECGLHFHINRSWFTKNSLKVLDYFINNDNNNEYLVKKGGRAFSYYCQREAKSLYDWGHYTDQSRYRALNLQNNNTVEIRFCDATGDYEVFMERLKFIYALVLFSKTVTFEEIIKKDNIKLFEDFFNNSFKKIVG